MARNYSTRRSDFNPRPPWGGRRNCYSAITTIFTISIHALRGEGDGCREADKVNHNIFQSTPSVGRATRFWQIADDKPLFQSTPSVGRATIKAGIMQSANGISIHALRGEGDNEPMGEQ